MVRVQTRWQASGIHLLISLLIAVGVLALMLELWYPAPLFQAAGGNDLLFILVGVDVAIGPLITLVIFRRGKRGLKFDLVTIAVLQVAALVYGSYVVSLARPAFIVFVKDRFEVVTPAELEAEALARAKLPQFRQPPWGGPVLVAADIPTDPKERQKLIEAALAGFDLQHFPIYWVPYAERTREVLAKAETIARLRAGDPATAKLVDDYLRNSGTKESDVRYLALRARRAWVAVLIDAKTAAPVKMLLAEKI